MVLKWKLGNITSDKLNCSPFCKRIKKKGKNNTFQVFIVLKVIFEKVPIITRNTCKKKSCV